MDHSAPVGGKFSFDAENRFPWKEDPPAPSAPTYDRDDIDVEVERLVNQRFSEHPGIPDLSVQPTTAGQAEVSSVVCKARHRHAGGMGGGVGARKVIRADVSDPPLPVDDFGIDGKLVHRYLLGRAAGPGSRASCDGQI